MRLSKNLTEAGLEKLQLVPAAAIVSLNSTIEVKERRRTRVYSGGERGGGGGGVKYTMDQRLCLLLLVKQYPLTYRDTFQSLSVDEALLYAKKEIKHASLVDNDDDCYLYARVFRNVSIFQRYNSLHALKLSSCCDSYNVLFLPETLTNY